MRISDWSSDVCSSDLPRQAAASAACLGASSPALAPPAVVRAHDRQQPPAHPTASPYPPRHRPAYRPRNDAYRLQSPGSEWDRRTIRSEEHTSELQSLMRISYAVFCLKKKKDTKHIQK